MVKISTEASNKYLNFDRYLQEDFVHVLSNPRIMKAFYKWSAFEDNSSTRAYFKLGNPPQIDFQSDPPFGCEYEHSSPPGEKRAYWGRILGMTWGKTWSKKGINIYSGLGDLTWSLYNQKREPQATDRQLLDMIEATIIHEMVHWSYFMEGKDEAKQYGGDEEKGTEAFEREAYGHLMGLDWHLFCFEQQTIPEFLGIAKELNADKRFRITAVLSYSPAANAGLQIGDVIIRMDGKLIASEAEFDAAMSKKNAYDKDGGNDKLSMEISRGAQTVIVNVVFPVSPSVDAQKKYGL